MKSKDVLEEHIAQVFASGHGVAGDEVMYFCKIVNYYKDSIMAVGPGKSCDKIYRDRFPRLIRDR